MNPIQKLLILGKKIANYYICGYENVIWVEGFKEGDSPICAKNVDHIYLEAIATSNVTNTTAVSDITINLTKIKNLCVEWENVGSNKTSSRLVVSNNKMGNSSDYIARLITEYPFARQIAKLDVSFLRGDYYIRIHSVAALTGRNSMLKVYRVWGEP